MKFRLQLVPLACLVALAFGKPQVVHFPEQENESPGEMPERLSVNRTPVVAPNICSTNELYYPGDQQSDWVCDCGPGYIYYPPKDGCFRAYRQEPCVANQYLILPKGKVVPECQNNPCRNDGFVSYNGKCYELDKSGPPCKPANEGGGIFGVNTTTLKLECLTDGDRLSLINFPQIVRREAEGAPIVVDRNIEEIVKINTVIYYDSQVGIGQVVKNFPVA